MRFEFRLNEGIALHSSCALLGSGSCTGIDFPRGIRTNVRVGLDGTAGGDVGLSVSFTGVAASAGDSLVGEYGGWGSAPDV